MMSIDQELPVLLRDIAGPEVETVMALDEVRRRGRRKKAAWRGMALVGAVAVAAALVVAVLTVSSSDDGLRVATGPADKVYVKLHTGANGATFGQLATLPEGTPPTELAKDAPDYIAVITLDPANQVLGYVKKADLFVEAGTRYQWSDDFLPIYADDGTTEVGTLLGRQTFVTLGDDFTTSGAATVEPAVPPSEAWYDQAFGGCVARELGRQHQMNPTVSEPSTAEVPIYDHGTRVPTTISLRQYCTEQAALTPDPGGDLTATFQLSNGHLTADYYRKIETNDNGRVSITNGEPVPFDEAQTIIAEQRKNQGGR